MPKIRINENDNTGVVQASAISNVVYIPILLNSKDTTSVSKQNAEEFSSIKLFNSASAFKQAAAKQVTIESTEGSVSIPIINPNTLGYKLCVHLLNIGFQILVEALVASDEPSFDKLVDKNLYDIRFLTLGAMHEGGLDLSGCNQDLITVAKTRGDCVALICADESISAFDYDVADVRSEFASLTNGEYAAAFTPWFYTRNTDFSDGKTNVAIPASFSYLFAYANAIKNCPEWYAMAGFQRGIIPELYDVCHAYTTAEVETLQARAADGEVELDSDSDNVGFAINPICYVRPAGNILYGNRTLRDNDSSKKLIASSFLNIRNGLSAIKKVMYEASKKYTFEQNGESLWINFQSYITPLLDRMKHGNGILGYSFTREETTAKARLKATLNIIPIEAVEDFDLEIELTDDLSVSE